MPTNHSIPVVIGVGDIINRSHHVDDAVEPMHLMQQAIVSAVNDTLLPLHRARYLEASIDSIDVVASWTWPYHDLPGLLSQELHIKPKQKHYSKHGGHQPLKLVDQAARRISQGTSSVAIIVGGESLASCKYLQIAPGQISRIAYLFKWVSRRLGISISWLLLNFDSCIFH